ncbi:hypothetical protein [Streptomyces sp. NPDC057702]|uniref:hypothetical protein n=1 Tax=unclassified Streptomyces TaxID=2593676 RepID=UPI00367B498B
MNSTARDETAMAAVAHVQVLDVTMQDVLRAAGIPVDTSSARPVAPFYAWGEVAPTGGSLPERPTAGATPAGWELLPQAVVVSAVDGLPRRALHVVRDPRVPHGWRVTELDLGAGVEPVEVVVLRHALRCVVLDARGALYACELDPTDGVFGPARRLSADDGRRWEELRTDGGGLAYARHGASRYCLIRAGRAQEAEFGYVGRGSTLTDVTVGGDQYTCAARVTPTDEHAVRVECHGADGVGGGQAYLTAEDGKRVRQLVALYPDGDGARLLVLNRDGSFSHAQLDCRSPRSGGLTPAPVPPLPADVEFADVVPHRGRERIAGGECEVRDVYALDTEQRVWVIRESRERPGHWLAPVPVDHEVGHIAVASREHGERNVALFSCHRDGPLLRLHVQQAGTRRWRSVEVRRVATDGEMFTADFHHVELSVLDATNTPLALHEVHLTRAADAGDCEIYWRRPGVTGAEPTLHTLTTEPQPFRTDHAGLLRFMVRATTLARSEVVLSDPGGSATATIRPGTKTLAYLAGTGTLRESDARGRLPVFDAEGTALAALVPGAAPDQVARTAHTIREIALHALHGTPPGSVANPLAVGDLWFGVERGVVGVGALTTDGASWSATGLTCAGRAVAEGVRLPVRGMEEGGRALVACFAGVGVTAPEVLGWLSTATDWKAVWEAKSALQRAMRLSAKVLDADGFARLDRAADAWLDARERDLDRLLDTLAHGLLKDKTFQASIAVAVPHSVVFEALNDPIAGWLEEKLQQLGPLTFPASRLDPALEQAFAAELGPVRERVLHHLHALWDAVGGLLGTKRQVYGQDLAHLLTVAREHLRVVVGCLREIAHSLLRVLHGAVEAITSVLNTPLDGSRLTPLWQLAARAARHEEDDVPTVGGLLALMAAYPATIAYKVTVGDAQASMFPRGTWPFHGPDRVPGGEEQALALGVLTSMSTCYQAFALAGIDLWAPREPDQPLLRHFHGGVLVSGLAVLGAGFGDWTLATIPGEDVPYPTLGEVVASIGSLLGLLGHHTPAGRVLVEAAPVVTTLAALCALPLAVHAWEDGRLVGGAQAWGDTQEWAAALGPLSPLFSFLGLPEFAGVPHVPEAHAMIDLGAHVAAAIAQFVDALPAR